MTDKNSSVEANIHRLDELRVPIDAGLAREAYGISELYLSESAVVAVLDAQTLATRKFEDARRLIAEGLRLLVSSLWDLGSPRPTFGVLMSNLQHGSSPRWNRDHEWHRGDFALLFVETPEQLGGLLSDLLFSEGVALSDRDLEVEVTLNTLAGEVRRLRSNQEESASLARLRDAVLQVLDAETDGERAAAALSGILAEWRHAQEGDGDERR